MPGCYVLGPERRQANLLAVLPITYSRMMQIHSADRGQMQIIDQFVPVATGSRQIYESSSLSQEDSDFEHT